MINIEDFAKVEIRAGKIISAETVEGSSKLLKLMVDFGDKEIEKNEGPLKEPSKSAQGRQVLSGIAKFVSPEDLVGTTCAFVTNLEPRSIMGFESQAMIMAVSTENNFSLLKISNDIPPGTLVK